MKSLPENTTQNLFRKLSVAQEESCVKQKKVHGISNIKLMPEPMFKLERGYLNQSSRWYGARSWWMKIFIGVVFVGVFAGLGAIGNMVIALIAVAAVVYGIIAFLLHDHYVSIIEKEAAVQLNVDNWQHIMQSSQQHLNTLVNKIDPVLQSLEHLDENKSHCIDVLEHGITRLSTQCSQLNMILEEKQKVEPDTPLNVMQFTATAVQEIQLDISYLRSLRETQRPEVEAAILVINSRTC